MSQLSANELARLEHLAFGIREVFGERGHTIGTALDQDESFRAGERARSGLVRALMQAALAISVGGVPELGLEQGEGGIRVIRSVEDLRSRHYRVLSAEDADGSFRILSSSDSILNVDEPGSFYLEESWVLGYTVDLDNQIADLFVAPVLGRRTGTPGELILGAEYHLTGMPPRGVGGFEPTDEDLPMGESEKDDQPGVAEAG